MQNLANQDIIDEKQFHKLYLQSVEDVFRFWTPAMQEEIARHNFPWRRGATDFKNYLFASERRYSIAYTSLHQTGEFNTVCDVGGFFGVFSLTLARLGHSAVMTEALQYYSRSFSPLFNFLSDNGVRIVDYDPFGDAPAFPGKFDVISVMAVLEHYPHSLRDFMENVLGLLEAGGKIYVEVPNIAYWPKRRALFMGKTPLVPISDIYRSSVPFIGHHHEFTIEELEKLAALSGLKIIHINHYNYSFRGPLIKRLCVEPLLSIMSMIPSMRECLSIVAVRSRDSKEEL